MPAVDTTADDGLLHTLVSYASSYVGGTLLGTIPAPIFQILAGFSNLVWRLVAGVSNDPTSWTSTVLPPLIALFAAYLSLLMAYRTLRSTVLLVWWGIKWGAIIGAGVALWAWWTGNQDAVTSVGETPRTAAGLASWAGGLAGLNGAATLATTLPLLSRLYGAATQDRPASAARGTRRSGRSSSSRQGARGQSVFDSLDDEDTPGQGATGATDAEALLRGVLGSAGSFYRSATSGGGSGRQRKTRSTAETVADLFHAANGGASRGAASNARRNGREASPEGEGQGDVLGGLLSSIGLEGLLDVAQGVSDDGDQSQMSRWMNMIRETVNEARGPPARSRNSRRPSRGRRGSSWFGSASGGEEDSDVDDDSSDGDGDFVLDDDDEGEDGSAGDWPWSASRQRGPAHNTRSKRAGRSGRRT